MTHKISDVIYKPMFLKFVEHYAKKFRARNGYGRWLHEYQDLENRGMFKPAIIRDQYIKMLKDQFYLGYIKGTAFWYIGVYAQEAAERYYDSIDSYLYKICVITGETALDEDDDEYIELSYDEASQICKALNEEAEEELFIIKKM